MNARDKTIRGLEALGWRLEKETSKYKVYTNATSGTERARHKASVDHHKSFWESTKCLADTVTLASTSQSLS